MTENASPRYLTDPAEAEENAAQYMRTELGFQDAAVTPPGADGGIDVRSSRAIAQVKLRLGQTGEPVLRDLVGARRSEHHLELLIFSASAYSRNAHQFASDVGIALFTFDVLGSITPASPIATAMLLRAREQAEAPAEVPPSSARSTGASARTSATGGSSSEWLPWWRDKSDPWRRVKFAFAAVAVWLFCAIPFGVAISKGVGDAFAASKEWVPVAFMAPFVLMTIAGIVVITLAFLRRRRGQKPSTTIR